MKILIALAFAGILGALATAGVFMMRDGRDGKPKTGNMMRALAVRVALSVLLFVCILLAYWAGWITPTGVPLGK
jgi:CHASE2 domain-containing sensor protein